MRGKDGFISNFSADHKPKACKKSNKTFLTSVLPKHFADEMLRKLRKALKIGTPDSGIAFTMPISGANNYIVRMLKQISKEAAEAIKRKEEMTMAEMKHVMIASMINAELSRL